MSSEPIQTRKRASNAMKSPAATGKTPAKVKVEEVPNTRSSSSKRKQRTKSLLPSPERNTVKRPIRSRLPKSDDGEGFIYRSRRNFESHPSAEYIEDKTTASGKKRRSDDGQDELPETSTNSDVAVTSPSKKRRMGMTKGERQNLPSAGKEKANNDWYCWICDSEGNLVCCDSCPRVYHVRCLTVENEPQEYWTCPECLDILQAELVETQSKAMAQVSQDQLSVLLKFALQRMKCQGSEPFHTPVDLKLFPAYGQYVFKPMDLSILEKNVRAKNYGSTTSFVADVKWILHNCTIFNGKSSKLTTVAKTILKICRHEMNEIEICPDCYFNSCTKKSKDWFCEPCRSPHPLVWAKMRGYPYWPAKALRVVDEQVDCRFFGEHDRAWVPMQSVFMLSQECPMSLKKKIQGWDESMAELKRHIQLLIKRHGMFMYYNIRTCYNPEYRQQDIHVGAGYITAAANWNIDEVMQEDASEDGRRQRRKFKAIVRPLAVCSAQAIKLRYLKWKIKKWKNKQDDKNKQAVRLDGNSGSPSSVEVIESDKEVDQLSPICTADSGSMSIASIDPETDAKSKRLLTATDAKLQGTGNNDQISVDVPKNILLTRLVESCKEKLGINTEEELLEKTANREEGELSSSLSSDDEQYSSDNSEDSNTMDKSEIVEPSSPVKTTTIAIQPVHKPARVKRPPAYLADFDSMDSTDSERLVIDEDWHSESSETPSISEPVKRKRVTSPKHGNIIKRKRKHDSTDPATTGVSLSVGQMKMLDRAGIALQHIEETNLPDRAKSFMGRSTEPLINPSGLVTMSTTASTAIIPCTSIPSNTVRCASVPSSNIPSTISIRQPQVSSRSNSVQSDSGPRDFPPKAITVVSAEGEKSIKEKIITILPSDKVLIPKGLNQLATGNLPRNTMIVSASGNDSPLNLNSSDVEVTGLSDLSLQSNSQEFADCIKQVSNCLIDVVTKMAKQLVEEKVGKTMKQAYEQQLAAYKWQYEQELKEARFSKGRESIEGEQLITAKIQDAVETALATQRSELEKATQEAIREVKKKQWCANCGNEASLYCCWNTSYCDYNCQRQHWTQHVHSCLQDKQQNGVADTGQANGSVACSSPAEGPLATIPVTEDTVNANGLTPTVDTEREAP